MDDTFFVVSQRCQAYGAGLAVMKQNPAYDIPHKKLG